MSKSTSPLSASLSIGTIIGGITRESRIWDEAIQHLTKEVIRAREIIPGLRVNVEYHVPGHILKPDFEGIRTGYYKKKDQLLKVQVALPVSPPKEPCSYLAGTLEDVIETVETWARGRDITFESSLFYALVRRLQTAWVGPTEKRR